MLLKLKKKKKKKTNRGSPCYFFLVRADCIRARFARFSHWNCGNKDVGCVSNMQ